jgi:hypothetical protein
MSCVELPWTREGRVPEQRGLALGVVAIVAAAASVGAAATLIVQTGPSQSQSVGKQIFSRGIGPDGRAVSRSGGIVGLAIGGCSTCHGAGGRGQHSGLLRGPDVTYANLTDPRGMLLPGGRRGPAYTDQTLRRAVTTGRRPGGGSLSLAMPHWGLTDEEWTGLLSFLKTLE